MLLMNWHSVGVKVVAISTSVLVVLSIGLLIGFSHIEKQKLIERKVEASRQLLLVAESIRDHVVNEWESGLITPEQLRQLTANNPNAKSIILQSVPTARAWDVIESKANEGGFRRGVARLSGVAVKAGDGRDVDDLAKHFATRFRVLLDNETPPVP